MQSRRYSAARRDDNINEINVRDNTLLNTPITNRGGTWNVTKRSHGFFSGAFGRRNTTDDSSDDETSAGGERAGAGSHLLDDLSVKTNVLIDKTSSKSDAALTTKNVTIENVGLISIEEPCQKLVSITPLTSHSSTTIPPVVSSREVSLIPTQVTTVAGGLPRSIHTGFSGSGLMVKPISTMHSTAIGSKTNTTASGVIKPTTGLLSLASKPIVTAGIILPRRVAPSYSTHGATRVIPPIYPETPIPQSTMNRLSQPSLPHNMGVHTISTGDRIPSYPGNETHPIKTGSVISSSKMARMNPATTCNKVNQPNSPSSQRATAKIRDLGRPEAPTLPQNTPTTQTGVLRISSL